MFRSALLQVEHEYEYEHEHNVISIDEQPFSQRADTSGLISFAQYLLYQFGIGR